MRRISMPLHGCRCEKKYTVRDAPMQRKPGQTLRLLRFRRLARLLILLLRNASGSVRIEESCSRLLNEARS
jgi:hypothetical protein